MKTIKHILLLLPLVAFAQPPYEPIAIWEREGEGDSSLYGSEILALGDQNNDGFNDWAVFGRGWGPPGQASEPRVEFFHGWDPPELEPYMVRLTETPEEAYIWDARTAGDLNGDGYVDWAIKVQLAERNVQKVYLGGPGADNEADLEFTAAWLLPLGDVNGDNYQDVYCRLAWNHPAAILYGGNPMDTLPDWTRNANLGYMSGGDLNHDGYSDFASVQDPFVVDVYLGAPQPDTLPTYHWPITSGWYEITRDVNGDDYADLCISRSGWGEVLFGSEPMDAAEDAHLNFPCDGGPEPGGPERIVSAGDFNGDGFGDVVMFADGCPDSYWGTLTLHLGAPWIYPVHTFVIYGWTAPLDLIHFQSAVSLGDINNDGVDDLGIGANGGIEQESWRGKAVVISGDTSLHVAADEPHLPLADNLNVNGYPNPFNSSTTIRIKLPSYRDNIDLNLFNVLGQHVKTETIRNVSGDVSYILDASAFSTGLYFLRVSSGNFHTTTKLMVLK